MRSDAHGQRPLPWTIAAAIAGFSILAVYCTYTNDYAMLATWFGSVYLIKFERYYAAAALTVLGALAKETMLLVPILVGLRCLRNRASFAAFAVTLGAFLLPTAVLRGAYTAPFARWAWWDMAYRNIPFLQATTGELLQTLRNNLKVALYFNVLWIIAARGVVRSSDPFVRDLALVLGVYLVLAYPVIYIRELRHFLPLAILILPIAVAEFEGGPRQRSGLAV